MLVALTLLSAAGMLLAKYLHCRTLVGLLTLVASTGFLATAVGAGASRTRYGRLILAALAFCWLGDCLGPRNFILGVWMFLLAHLGFMAAFCVEGLERRRVWMSGAVVLPVGVVILSWLYPHVPARHHVTVFAYMGVISLMAILAGGLRDDSLRRWVLVGVAVFYVSDLFVARWRFVSPGFVNALGSYPLYYTACLLLALSVLKREGCGLRAK
jgi:uncharacterized membrane protein YhhN